MQFSVIFSGFALSSLVIAQDPMGACAKGVHLIAAAGANNTDPTALSRFAPTVQAITAAIPGSDAVSLPYDKAEPRLNHLSPDAIPNGITTFQNYVSEYHAACPDTKIVVAGYSAGAVITMSGLCDGNVPQDLAGSTIIANIAYGDETRTPGQPYDLGTCTSGHGTQPRSNTAGCGDYIPITQSYCDFNDPRCCGGPAEDFAIHFVYPGKYDGAVASYVKSQWGKSGGSSSSSMSSSSSISSSPMMSSMASSMASSMVSSSMAFSSMMPASSAMVSGASSMTSSASGSTAMGTLTSGFLGPTGSAGTDSTGTGSSGNNNNLHGAAGSASSTPAPANPNGAFLLAYSSVLLNAACIGAMVLGGAILL